MPMLDPDTGEVSNVGYGLDDISQTSDNKSIFDQASDILTKGVPLTGLAIANSFANTAVEATNWVTGSNFSKLSVNDETSDGDLQSYYKQHQQGIEGAGLVIGSLIPGTAAMKGLKVATEAGYLGDSLKTATGLLSGPGPAAISSIRDDMEGNSIGSSLFGSINADKVRALSANVGNQALQGLVFSAATAATMKASPLLDNDNLSDISSDLFYGALTGGVVGGLIGGIRINALFNKASLMADTDTKSFEQVKDIGLGNAFPGERAANFLSSLDDIQPADGTTAYPNRLAAAKANTAIVLAQDKARTALTALVPSTDKDVSNALFDSVMAMSNNGASTDDIFRQIGRLGSIDRVTNPVDNIPNPDIFYVAGKGTPSASLGSNPATLFSSTAVGDFKNSEAYVKKPFGGDVQIATATDTRTLADGTVIPAFQNAQEAFDAGHDIYINAKQQTIINPNAPNIAKIARPGESRPLNQTERATYNATGQLPAGSDPLLGTTVAAPLDVKPVAAILNTVSNSITDSAVPVVGDYGVPRVLKNGLQYGKEFSPQSAQLPQEGFSSLSTIDANARYVWAAQTGLTRGQDISSEDIPFLEVLHNTAAASKDGYQPALDSLAQRGVTIDGEQVNNFSQQSLLNLIQKTKDDLIAGQANPTSKLGLTDLALRANVPQDYISNGLKGTNFLADTDQWSKVNNIRLMYNISNLSMQDGNVLKGLVDFNYRLNLIKSANTDRVASFFGPDFTKFLSKDSADQFSNKGSGNTFLGAANAEYNTPTQRLEGIGVATGQHFQSTMGDFNGQLLPFANMLRADNGAAAEVGMFNFVRHSTSQSFTLLPDDLAQKYFPNDSFVAGTMQSGGKIAVLSDSLVKDKNSTIVDWNKNYQPDNFLTGDVRDKAVNNEFNKTLDTGLYTYYKLSPNAANWEVAKQSISDQMIQQRNAWFAAQGINKTIPLGNLYAPAIDTANQPFFALVKLNAGTAFNDGGTSMMVARSADELQQKISTLGPEFTAYTKNDIKNFQSALGDYQYDRNFSQSAVNTEMQRKGILNNLTPDTSPSTIINNYMSNLSNTNLGLIRDHVELGNAQLFAELRAMGERYQNAATSQTGFVGSLVAKTSNDPYASYIRTALGISNKDANYPLWQYAQDKLESFADTAFNTTKNAFFAAKNDAISWEQASKVGEQFGLGNPFGTAVNAMNDYSNGLLNNRQADPGVFKNFVSRANTVLANSVIRLDTFQQLVEMTSTPIMMLPEVKSALSNPAVAKMFSTVLPDGSQKLVPSMSKVVFQGVADTFNKSLMDQWAPVYEGLGVNKTQLNNLRSLQDEIAAPFSRGFDQSRFVQTISNMTNLAGKLSGADLQRNFTHMVVNNVGRNIFEAAGYTGQDLLDNIRTFANRVQGNYIASQRPVAFQGPLGQAVGLFQTYQFNLMQQLFRHVEEGNGKQIGMLMGLQSTMYGLQGLPGFQIINNHLVGNASGNNSHADLYSGIKNLVGNDIGNWMLYGTLANATNTGLYTRGDINPRQITLLPVNPLDFPAVRGGINFTNALLGVSQKISAGGSIPASILLGLEHNGLSRPLTGLAQLAQGFATTPSGQLISAIQPSNSDDRQGYSDLFSISNAARLLGARPLDEAVAMDEAYRNTLYGAKDTARLKDLGSAVKTALYANQAPTAQQTENFAQGYASAGGNISNFNSWMMQQAQGANASIANKVFSQLRSPRVRQAMIVMGGQPLTDYRNSPPDPTSP